MGHRRAEGRAVGDVGGATRARPIQGLIRMRLEGREGRAVWKRVDDREGHGRAGGGH